MAGALTNTMRLARAGVVLARHGVRFVPAGTPVPLPLRLARIAAAPLSWISGGHRRGGRDTRLADALTALGPSYIKLGQFLATRADVIGPVLAGELSLLQDNLPPFSMEEARRAVEEALGGRVDDHFAEFGPAVAAASIAQVHKAAVIEPDGRRREVAVKILRPDIERKFRRDLDSFYFAARQIERWHEPSRRLKPVAVVDTLKRSTELEMDLRLEAAAISEMAENTAGDEGFRVPEVDWRRTAKRVLTVEWIDGIRLADHERLIAAGVDRKSLGLTVMRSFLTQAMRDGFFHADMHQGNLFVDHAGRLVAVDFGIMGRLGTKERRFLAEILYGLITRDYRRAAAVHFWAGYVPPEHPVEVFAQALRAIGEPIHGRTADEISMADLLGQLFAYTDVFDMQTRPELILLQKTMVVVEGVARSLDPALNMWVAAEPVAKEWIEANLGPAGRLREAGEGASAIAAILSDLPALLTQGQQTAIALNDMAREGLRLDEGTVRQIAREEARSTRWGRLALWVGAVSLAVLALGHLWR